MTDSSMREPLKGETMEPLDALEISLTALHIQRADYYAEHIDSWIADAVYQCDYLMLGKLLSQMLPITEGRPFVFAGNFDGQNVFEEFVCDLIRQLFQEWDVVTEGVGAANISLSNLQIMLTQCRVV